MVTNVTNLLHIFEHDEATLLAFPQTTLCIVNVKINIEKLTAAANGNRTRIY